MAIKNISLSIIIPTYNNCRLLKNALLSLINHPSICDHEVIVVDNASTDNTKTVVGEMINKCSSLKYIYEIIPGLLSARHKAVSFSTGDILCFLDEDVVVGESWLDSVLEVFSDNSVHLAGGCSLPLYEKAPPSWLDFFWTRQPSMHQCPWLSLIWQGDKAKECNLELIWGLNFCIRKSTLIEVGGFNPDVLPDSLQHFQGDGESGLARKLKQHGYVGMYHPGIMLHHVIPGERMTHEYFKKRFYYEGIVNSYADIRRNKGVLSKTQTIHKRNETASFAKKYWQKFRHPRSSIRWFLQQKGYIKNQNLNSTLTEEEQLKSQFYQAYLYGYNYHQEMVNSFPELLRWVLKEDYFDYKLPDLKGYSS